jgi:Leucine-rich repeat (LRR) protein
MQAVNDFSQLLQLVKATTVLQKLRLHAPALTTAPDDFFRMAANSLSSLRVLSLSSVRLGASDSRPGLLDSIAGPTLHPLANLVDLSLRGCFLADDGARALSVLLENMPSLESLCLADNRMTKAGVSSLVNSWEKDGRGPSLLHTLDLSNNPLGLEGVYLNASLCVCCESCSRCMISSTYACTAILVIHFGSGRHAPC